MIKYILAFCALASSALAVGPISGGSPAPTKIVGPNGATVDVSSGNVGITAQSGGAINVSSGDLYTAGIVDFTTSVSPVVTAAGHYAMAFDGTNILASANGGAYVATKDVAQTLTNKTISGASNTLTNLAAANLIGSHTLPDGVLSANVPLLNAANTFTGANLQTFGGTITVSGGTITGGASGLSFAAGGANQSITHTPTGGGSVIVSTASTTGDGLIVHGGTTANKYAVNVDSALGGGQEVMKLSNTNSAGVAAILFSNNNSLLAGFGIGGSSVAAPYGGNFYFTASSSADEDIVFLTRRANSKIRFFTGTGPTEQANLDNNGLLTLSGSVKVGGGQAITKTLSATATLDFASTAAQTSSELTITLTGAVDGDDVILSPPNASSNANTCFTARVSAADTVTVKFNNYSSGAVDPASGTFRVSIIRF